MLLTFSAVVCSRADFHDSRDSPKAISAAAYLKRRIISRQAAKLAEQTSMQSAETSSDVQVASTAEASARPVTPQRRTRGPDIPSSAPAKIQDDGWRPQTAGGEDNELFGSVDRDQISQVLALRNEREAESNKENIVTGLEPQKDVLPPNGRRRLIDPQPNAVRVDFDTQESDFSRQASEPDDLSEDDGFQQQHLPSNAGLRRSLKPATKRAATEPARSQGPSLKKVRVQEANGSESLDTRQDRQIDRPSPSQMDEYMAANAAAKEKKAWQLKPPQVRKPWTEEETERLLDLIEEHGTSWKLLKDEDFAAGDILEYRDQVALKDKARNMKMDYLKYVCYHISNSIP